MCFFLCVADGRKKKHDELNRDVKQNETKKRKVKPRESRSKKRGRIILCKKTEVPENNSSSFKIVFKRVSFDENDFDFIAGRFEAWTWSCKLKGYLIRGSKNSRPG